VHMRSRPASLAAALLGALGVSVATSAQEGLQEIPEAAPPPPAVIQDGQELEPDVTIVQRKDARVEEYRMNGKLYMVKVIPIVGPAYFMQDSDGDGKLETRFNDARNSALEVPKWVIFSW
jgi:hypothetical protein